MHLRFVKRRVGRNTVRFLQQLWQDELWRKEEWRDVELANGDEKATTRASLTEAD